MRLDLFLVEKNYYPSRSKARAAIEEKAVLVDGKEAKASLDVSDDNKIEIIKNTNPYVSRGGLKLEKAIKEFRLDFSDKVIVDIGASTGGFTDCALQFNASKVYSIDVGTNQLAEKLLEDPRVISLEQTNIKDIPYFPEVIDYFVMDVSFVSIKHLLGVISKFLDDNNIKYTDRHIVTETPTKSKNIPTNITTINITIDGNMLKLVIAVFDMYEKSKDNRKVDISAVITQLLFFVFFDFSFIFPSLI